MTTRQDLDAALQTANVRAFLTMLRLGEGTTDEAGYRRMFGGQLFDSFADHPRVAQTHRFGAGKTITSTAAGAYQFLSKTWDGLVRQYGFTDFSPASQDAAAVALIAGRKALDDVIAGRFDTAVAKCAREWASLPGSPYGQPTVSIDKARAVYLVAGGQFDEQPDPVHAPAAQNMPTPIVDLSSLNPTPPTGDATMPPFVLTALASVIDIAPKLIGLFGGGTEVAQRNEKAAQIVVDIAKKTVEATNEQDLVEKIKADPEAAAAVRQAIEANWFTLTTNMVDIDKAREVNSNTHEFWKQPAIWVTLMLMPLLYFVVWQVLTSTTFSSEVQSMVISGVVTGVLGSIVGFWFGTSFSSSRKTELQGK